MSDSEEEFASADEGEGMQKTHAEKDAKEKKQAESPKKKTGSPEAVGGDGALKQNPLKSSKTTVSEESGVLPIKGKGGKQKRKPGNRKRKEVDDVSEKEKMAQGKEPGKQEESSSAEIKLKPDNGEKVHVPEEAAESAAASPENVIDDKKSVSAILQSSESETKDRPISGVSDPVKVKTPQSDAGDVQEQKIERDSEQRISDVESPSKDNTLEKQGTGSGWGGWSSWGSSLVSAATASVSTFTNQVGEGFSTVLETVETTLGAPPPEELAREKLPSEEDKSAEPEAKKPTSQDARNEGETVAEDTDKNKSESGGSGGGGWLSNWGVSNITSIVSDTGKTLVTGSLDVLETIGKKTYDTFSEHDPGVRKALKGGNKPNLSSVLRDAKNQAEERSRMEQEFEESRQAHFGAMFDEYQGLAHLEALEMLSNQSENKVQALLAGTPTDKMGELKQKLVLIKERFELEELDDDDDEAEHDFPKLIIDHLSSFHRGTSPAKLNSVHAKVRAWITNFVDEEEGSTSDPKEIHKVSIQSLAEFTSKTIEQFHKAGELLLVQADEQRDIVERANSLASITRVVCTEVGILSSKFTKCLNKVAENVEDSDSINSYITNVYLEASNSSTYIQDAFQLLLPVLQQAAIQETQDDS